MDKSDTPAPLTADDVRSEIVSVFEQFKPQLQAYHAYAEKLSALNLEYHRLRLGSTFTSAPVEELILAATLDARQTPKRLDSALAQLANVPVKRVVFDRVNSQFLLFA